MMVTTTIKTEYEGIEARRRPGVVFYQVCIAFSNPLDPSDRSLAMAEISRLVESLGCTLLSIAVTRNLASLLVEMPSHGSPFRIEKIVASGLSAHLGIRTRARVEPVVFNGGLCISPELELRAISMQGGPDPGDFLVD